MSSEHHIKVGSIYITEEAKKQLKKLPKSIQKKFKKQIEIFKVNPYYPSLQFKKYHAINPNLYEIRIDRKYRIILEQEVLLEENKITSNFTILAVGKHDILDKGNF